MEKISAVTFRASGGAGLRGAAKVCVYVDPPFIKQPFWDVESVSVPFAPVAEFSREDIGPWRQVQLPDLHLEFGREIWIERNGSPPVRIAAFTRRVWPRHGPDNTARSSTR